MSTKEKLNYFEGKFDEIKRARMRIDQEDQEVAREFSEWLISQGVPEKGTMIDVIRAFRKEQTIIV